MEQEKEKNEETFVKKVVQTALEAERQIRIMDGKIISDTGGRDAA